MAAAVLMLSFKELGGVSCMIRWEDLHMETCLLLCQRGPALGSLQLGARLPQRSIRLLPHLRHLPSKPLCKGGKEET